MPEVLFFFREGRAAKTERRKIRTFRISLPWKFGIRYLAKPVFYSDVKGKLSREAHALASCENLRSVRLTFFKLNRQIQNGVHWKGPRWPKEILRRIYVTHA